MVSDTPPKPCKCVNSCALATLAQAGMPVRLTGDTFCQLQERTERSLDQRALKDLDSPLVHEPSDVTVSEAERRHREALEEEMRQAAERQMQQPSPMEELTDDGFVPTGSVTIFVGEMPDGRSSIRAQWDKHITYSSIIGLARFLQLRTERLMLYGGEDD